MLNVSTSNPRADTVYEKIRSFGELDDGWHFGEGHAATTETVDMARRISDIGRTLGLRVDAFPSPDGDISVEFYRGDETLEVVVSEGNRLDIFHDRGTGTDYEEIFDIEDVDIGYVRQYLRSEFLENESEWTSFGYSTLDSTLNTGIDFRVTASRITETVSP